MKRLEIGENAYNLKYSINALAELQEMSGKSIEQHVADMAAGSIVGLRWILWAGLIEMQDSMTVRQVGALLDDYFETGGEMDTLSDTLTAALEDSGFFKALARAAEKLKEQQAKARAEKKRKTIGA